MFGMIPVSSQMVFSPHYMPVVHGAGPPEGWCCIHHPSSCAQTPAVPDAALLHGVLMSPDLLQPEFWNKDRSAALVSRGNAGFWVLGYLNVEAPRSRKV